MLTLRLALEGFCLLPWCAAPLLSRERQAQSDIQRDARQDWNASFGQRHEGTSSNDEPLSLLLGPSPRPILDFTLRYVSVLPEYHESSSSARAAGFGSNQPSEWKGLAN